MARHDDPDRVGPVRETNRAHGGRTTDPPRKLAVRARLSTGNLAQRAPHRPLEFRASGVDRQAIDGAQLAAKICFEGTRVSAGVARWDHHDSSLP
jgi:hypothetical protein